jgi:hypothetical protein
MQIFDPRSSWDEDDPNPFVRVSLLAVYFTQLVSIRLADSEFRVKLQEASR